MDWQPLSTEPLPLLQGNKLSTKPPSSNARLELMTMLVFYGAHLSDKVIQQVVSHSGLPAVLREQCSAIILRCGCVPIRMRCPSQHLGKLVQN